MSERRPCAGVTRAGRPCARLATADNGLCAWHDPERKRAAFAGREMKPTKRCRTCNRELARRHFVPTGNRSPFTGERYGSADCRDCLAKARRAEGKRERHVRVNARGDVWCNRCARYLPADRFNRHPSRPHTFWSYCRDCVIEIDRARYHRTKFRPDKAAGAVERTERKARRRKAEHRERVEFVQKAIGILGRRGFTRAEIAKLARVDQSRLYPWLAGDALPTPAVESRFAELLRATAHMPIGDKPARRRRLPHPELAAVMARTEGLAERHPTRSRWRNRENVRELPERREEAA